MSPGGRSRSPVWAGLSTRAGRTAVLPEVAELLAQLLARSRPVVLDSVTQLGDMSFDFELILLDP